MHTESNFIGEAGFYASSIGAAGLARPLDVISGADDIADSLNTYKSVLDAQIEYGRKVIKSLAYAKSPIKESMLIPQIEHSQSLMQSSMKVLEGYKSSILIWNLTRSDKEILLSVVEKTMSSVEELFDQQEALRWAILEHNVDCEPKGKGKMLSSSEEIEGFFASL